MDDQRLQKIAEHYTSTGNGKETMRACGCSYRVLRLAVGLYAPDAKEPSAGRPERTYQGLGERPDAEVAKACGVTVSTVAKARRRRGIPPYGRRPVPGTPRTGSDLLAYREGAKLSLRALAALLRRDSGEGTYTHQAVAQAEGRGATVLSRELRVAILRAMEGGSLPKLNSGTAGSTR